MKLDWTLPQFLNLMIKRFRAIRKPVKRKREKIGRNEICPCGSLMKYKYCCLPKKRRQEQKQVIVYREIHREIKNVRQPEKRQ